MRILLAYDTDIGKSKNINQDALCIKAAQTNLGLFSMAILCDGMGGYSSGEVASATLVRAFSDWFENDLPILLQDFSMDSVRVHWNELVSLYSRLTVEYGLMMQPNIKLGTTLTGILITEHFGAEIIHVGDSRLYWLGDSMDQLTHDQSKIAYLVAQNMLKLTENEIEHHPERHILSQCIGGSKVGCEPENIRLEPKELMCNTGFLLCSDGFRHEVTRDEMKNIFRLNELTDEVIMKKKLRQVIKMDMERGEQDNISAVLMKVIR